jgi:hypothetical protein
MKGKKYFTGKPCKRGHVAERLVSTRGCVECQREAMRAWVAANPDKHRANGRAWKRRNKHGYNEQAKARMRAYYRKRNGLPTPPYPETENCECCSTKLLGGVKTHLDHDHETGKFRGWLCNRCNRGLGYFGDTIEGLEMALRYLRRVVA